MGGQLVAASAATAAPKRACRPRGAVPAIPRQQKQGGLVPCVTAGRAVSSPASSQVMQSLPPLRCAHRSVPRCSPPRRTRDSCSAAPLASAPRTSIAQPGMLTYTRLPRPARPFPAQPSPPQPCPALPCWRAPSTVPPSGYGIRQYKEQQPAESLRALTAQLAFSS